MDTEETSQVEFYGTHEAAQYTGRHHGVIKDKVRRYKHGLPTMLKPDGFIGRRAVFTKRTLDDYIANAEKFRKRGPKRKCDVVAAPEQA